MTKAFDNIAKLGAWADSVTFGADQSGDQTISQRTRHE